VASVAAAAAATAAAAVVGGVPFSPFGERLVDYFPAVQKLDHVFIFFHLAVRKHGRGLNPTRRQRAHKSHEQLKHGRVAAKPQRALLAAATAVAAVIAVVTQGGIEALRVEGRQIAPERAKLNVCLSVGGIGFSLLIAG
jgi:hypothetical protein